MTPTEFKSARKSLGLSIYEMAQVLRVSHRHIRRMEADPSDMNHRAVSPMTETFVNILLGRHGKSLSAILKSLLR